MIVHAVACERGGRVQVKSDAPGRACRFDFGIGSWRVTGPQRAIAIGRRVELELRRRGVRWETLSVRIAAG